MDKVIKKVQYHVQVYEILRRQILSGQLPYGEKINEYRISQEIGVSRSPVREALRMLEQDELVVPCDTGLVVNPMDKDSLREIYECRVALESYAAGLSARHITGEALKELENCVKESRKYHKAQEYDKVIEYNTLFHDTISGFCNNHSLIKTIQKYSDLFSLSRIQIFTEYKRSEEPYLTEHEEIIKAFRNKDAALAETLMRRHIEGDYAVHLTLTKHEGM